MKNYLLPGLIFIVSIFLALYNIGGFPKMVGDEGIYVSQAYWLAYFGKLGPYTYWYDHSPLGWVQIGLWQRLTGALQLLDYSVLSARVFMGIILGGTTTLLYLLTKQLTRSILAALLASVIYIGSALTLTFGRMVLLDNLAIFWFVFSLLLLFTHPNRLRYLIISAATLSFAILSKESLLFFLLPYLLSVYILNKDNKYKKYALLVSFTTCFFLLSFFPLLALLKGELFPRAGQVSLFGTFLFQAERGSGIPFWQSGSHFREMLEVWLNIDPILIILGTFSTLLLFFMPLSRNFKLIPLFSIFFLAFLTRGGQIYDFYLIPLLPLLALNISLLLSYFSRLTKSNLLTLFLLITMLTYTVTTSTYPYTLDATSSQTSSIDALKDLPEESVIVSNNYAYLDIYLQHKNQIHWYQKIETDRLIQESTPVITHFLIDEQFSREISSNQLPYLKSYLDAQAPIATFGRSLSPGEIIKPYAHEYITLYQENKATKKFEHLISMGEINEDSLNQLSKLSPSSILLTSTSFTNSTDLETSIKLLRARLDPDFLIIVTQDDTGSNTIPWISTPGRSFYKSSEEAASSTLKKTLALKQLGFNGAVITSSTNQDGYLSTILQSAASNLLPLVRFTQEIPSIKASILVDNKTDLEKLEQSNYSGQIFYLINLEEYQQIGN